MKYHILLLKDVINYGRKGDFVHVAPGFARNFLLPHGHAVLASGSTVKMRERLKTEREEQAVRDRTTSNQLASKLEGQMYEIVTKVDPDGHMYGSITQQDIVDLVAKQGHTIEKKHVALLHPIKVIGNHQINLKLPEGVLASFGLVVKPDREIKKKEKPKTEEIEEKVQEEGKEQEGKS